jgi:LytS/YehU family sensor histidine kinase
MIMGAIAIGILHFIRVRKIKQQLQEERAKNTEAELAWLKNQINPHFLFNTLNNISSLTQIDSDAAQNAIAQLSDLLRYAMYETNKPKVRLDGEIEFMRNYVDLMKLRCNDMTTVNCQLSVVNDQLEVAPLLFISLIENAFKHGVSSSRPSRIDIRLEQIDNQIIFTCDNTNYPKDDADRSGSGIGLENTRRRLELMYPDSYSWEQTLQNESYHIRITLHL